MSNQTKLYLLASKHDHMIDKNGFENQFISFSSHVVASVVGRPCTSNTDCRGIQYTSCTQNTCSCVKGYENVKGVCQGNINSHTQGCFFLSIRFFDRPSISSQDYVLSNEVSICKDTKKFGGITA